MIAQGVNDTADQRVRYRTRSLLVLLLPAIILITVFEASAVVLMPVVGNTNSRAAAHINRAVESMRARRMADARRELDQAIRMAPKLWPAYSNRALVFMEQKQWDLALQDLNTAIRIHPFHAGTVANRAAMYRLRGNYDLELVNLENALKLRPNRGVRANILSSRAWLRATCPDPRYRNGAQAIADAKRACELSRWRVAGYLDDLAAAHAESGDFAAAVRFQEQGLQLAAEEPPGRMRRMRARLALYQRGRPYRDTTPTLFP